MNNNKHTYASIVPLIGGETLGTENVFGKRPEYILSYEAFQANDSQLLNHYNNEVPYYLIDKNEVPNNLKNVDVLNAVCPCAGLSSLSTTSSSDNKTNDWMIESAKYVLGKVKPKVFWGENAPRLASKMGEPIVNQLKEIANKEGYTFSLYKTKSLLHGLSQVRTRSFYFFWKEEGQIPILPFIHREHETIEETIRAVKKQEDDPMNDLVNSKVPSEDPFYRYILEEIHGGITHNEFQESLSVSVNTFRYIENNNITYDVVRKWILKNNYNKEADKCQRMYDKLKSGGNIMRNSTTIPKGYIGAFVGHLPTMVTHPDEDRYLTIRECLSIMKMPSDFQLKGGLKNLNMICQSVPVTTAADMAAGVMDYLDGKLDIVHSNFLIQNNHNQTTNHQVTSDLNEFLL